MNALAAGVGLVKLSAVFTFSDLLVFCEKSFAIALESKGLFAEEKVFILEITQPQHNSVIASEAKQYQIRFLVSSFYQQNLGNCHTEIDLWDASGLLFHR